MTERKCKCINRRCRAEIETPGRCEICAEIWADTLVRARKAYARRDIYLTEAGVFEVEVEPVEA